MWLTPSNKPGSQGLSELPWMTICHRCHYTSLPGELRAVCTIPLGKDNWKLAPGLSWTLSCDSFTFADFNRYLLAVINHNCEHNCKIEGEGPVETTLSVRLQSFYTFFHIFLVPSWIHLWKRSPFSPHPVLSLFISIWVTSTLFLPLDLALQNYKSIIMKY